METPQTPDYGEPFDMPLRYDPESDWGCVRDANNATACIVRKPMEEREACDYRRIREDPMKDRAERIVTCVNACAGMVDPAAEIQAMREAIKEAHEALDNCIEFINVAHIIEAQWQWEPIKLSNAALAKLQPFLKP